MKNTPLILTISILLQFFFSQTAFAENYLQQFCRTNGNESLKIQIQVDSGIINSQLTYSSNNSEPVTESYQDLLFLKSELSSDDLAYLTDDLIRWVDLNSNITSGIEFIGAEDINDANSVTRIFYVIKDENNTEYLYVKNTGLYYYGNSSECIDSEKVNLEN